MIIQVTGSRYASVDAHEKKIRNALVWASLTPGPHELREGGAFGVDGICRDLATNKLGWSVQSFPASWSRCDPDWNDPHRLCPRCTPDHRRFTQYRGEYCPTAGNRRNQAMIDALLAAEGERKVCVAFPIPALGSTGTEDCLTRAWRSEIPTLVIPLGRP